jgi:hypothetical protein
VILDGKENESVGVLLEKRLINLLWLVCNLLFGLLLGFDNVMLDIDLLRESGERCLVDGVVFFVFGVEVDLLNGGLHLERVNGSGGLRLTS